MLYTLRLHKSLALLSVRPKKYPKPIVVTFTKPIDAAILYTYINEHKFSVDLNQENLIVHVDANNYNLNYQLENWVTKLDEYTLQQVRIGVYYYVTEDIEIRQNQIVCSGHIKEKKTLHVAD